MSIAALAYTAGFLDADGHIGFYQQQGKTYQPNFAIVNANKLTLIYIQLQIGGQIYTRVPKNENHSTTYCLQLTNKRDISKALDKLVPYLVGKRDIAILVKEFCDSRILINPTIGSNNPLTNRELDIVSAVQRLTALFYKKPVRNLV